MEANTVDYSFSDFELNEVQKHISKYPDTRSAVMPVLWMAQEKFGWLSEGAMKLVADSINMPYAHVYGVASFYTMYFKRKVPKYLFDVCTCFSCGEVGGNEMIQHIKEYLNVDEKGFSEDGLFWVRPAECLGACDTGPMMQVQNGHYVHNLTREKCVEVIEDIKSGDLPGYVSIPMIDQSKLGPMGKQPVETAPAPAQPEKETPAENNSDDKSASEEE